jgi:uncharacterized membrane protein YagU involved in acid resistance
MMMDSKRITAGIVGGLVGGVLFGMMMQMMGVLPMIAALIGQDGVAVGWLVHLVISALLGAAYAVTLAPLSTGWGGAIGLGVLYGIVWWVLGALLLMPLRMGMPTFEVGALQLQSLVGHLVYGVALGAVYHAIAHSERREDVVPGARGPSDRARAQADAARHRR